MSKFINDSTLQTIEARRGLKDQVERLQATVETQGKLLQAVVDVIRQDATIQDMTTESISITDKTQRMIIAVLSVNLLLTGVALVWLILK